MSDEKQYDWPRMPMMGRFGHVIDASWHRAINDHAIPKGGSDEWPRWMYDAKHAAQEVPRLALLFECERNDKLCKVFRKCSCCAGEKHVVDNHLTCCLGVECRKCPHLAALDKAEGTLEEKDWMKAWTCAGHILSKGGDVAGEGFLVTVDDRMYWDSVMESLASSPQEDEPTQ